ncbi:hypothetical protein L3Y34_012183 [Caenorhabditis briggsae]|uniref:Uncharacterized protein n=1 Tax=Caenorhabditis briggsae TaxID=6238 RepID=A0AAE8ZV22_CAEBR|nr:hypothetical protein L3Y34_012183 [Caenorhabditis briggsae]
MCSAIVCDTQYWESVKISRIKPVYIMNIFANALTDPDEIWACRMMYRRLEKIQRKIDRKTERERLKNPPRKVDSGVIHLEFRTLFLEPDSPHQKELLQDFSEFCRVRRQEEWCTLQLAYLRKYGKVPCGCGKEHTPNLRWLRKVHTYLPDIDLNDIDDFLFDLSEEEKEEEKVPAPGHRTLAEIEAEMKLVKALPASKDTMAQYMSLIQERKLLLDESQMKKEGRTAKARENALLEEVTATIAMETAAALQRRRKQRKKK